MAKAKTLQDIQNRVVTLKGNKRTQTTRVKFKASGVTGIINLKHFDDHLHQQLPPEEASTAGVEAETVSSVEQQAAARRTAEIEAAKRVTPFPKAELVTMTVEALRLLPEWAKIPASKRAKLKDKEDMIKAIVQYR